MEFTSYRRVILRTEFYIFRHGETELNRQKRWQGSGMDYDLTENGIVQAQKLAAKLQGKGIEIIFSSPLRRAFHTAEIAAAVFGVPVAVENDLRECFYGEAEGRLIADLQREVPQIVNNWNRPQFWDLRFEGGESKGEALQRVLAVLERLAKENADVIGIAIHGGTMASLLNYFGFEFETVPNCGAFHLIYENGKGTVNGGIF